MKKLVLALFVSMTWSLTGLAQSKTTTTKKTTVEPTTEQRMQMAKMHENVAQCLRSNKSMTECHNEMMKECPMGESCTMGMGMGMWRKQEGMGRGKGGMMGKSGTGTTTESTTETKEKKSY